MLSWSRRVEKISLDLAIYKFNLDLFKDETSSYCSSQGVTFLGQSIIQSYLLKKLTHKASCSIPIPRTLPIQAPIAMLGINNPAGT